MENAKILIANTCMFRSTTSLFPWLRTNPSAMDTDKIKVFGARVKVDSTGKLAELERAERVCLFDIVSATLALNFFRKK